jgi:hypothetical protein
MHSDPEGPQEASNSRILLDNRAQSAGANIGPNATLIFELELLEIVR